MSDLHLSAATASTASPASAVATTSSRALLSPRVIAALAIAAWCVVEWLVLRQPMIAADWVGWRESDTQAIARHLVEPGSSFLYPRIDWGGDGPGYVETELQLYPAIVALFLRVLGDVEWPGQLVSLLSIASAAWVLFVALARRHGEGAALLGLGAFLLAPVTAFIGSSVQPEALCLLLFVVAWSYFLRFEEDGRAVHLVPFALVGALAMLVKPTAAQLGVASFVALLVGSRQRLRRVDVWCAWGFMLAALAAFMWHAHGLFAQYHNTFGVLSGGDSKVPKLRHLLLPGVYRMAATTVLVWGFGVLGALAVAVAVVRRRVDAPTWGLLAASVLWTVIALRYVCNASWGGVHYTIVCAVLAAHAVAAIAPRASDSARSRRTTLGALGVAALVALVFYVGARRRGMQPTEEARQVMAVASELSTIARPTDLVVVRSSRFSYDRFWNTPNNYQDPRVFYLSKTHGWVVGWDETDPHLLEDLARRGAAYYVEPGREFIETPIDPWLDAHGTLVATTPLGGRIFRLGGAT